MSIHEEHEAFALLDEAIEALFDATRDEGGNPDDVPVDAVLLIGVQRVNDNGARVGHVEVYPRAGSQSAHITRGLVAEADKLLDQATDAGDDEP